MTKRLLGIFLAAVFALAPSAVFAQEQAQEFNESDIFLIVGRMDPVNNAVCIWWPEEVWATLAYKDKTNDARLGYALFKSLLKDYIVFSIMPMDGETNKAVEIEGTPILENDAGVRVSSVAAHSSLAAIMPNILAFPARDARGRELLGGGTKQLKVSVAYPGNSDSANYVWSLPVQYPEFVQEAMKQMNKPPQGNYADMTEDEIIYTFLPITMIPDLRTGMMGAYMPTDVFSALASRDPEVKNNSEAKAQMDAIINGHTFFMLTSFDQDAARLKKTAATASAVDTTGKTVHMDTEAYNEIMGALRDTSKEGFELLVFPSLGKKGRITLLLNDEETKNNIEFNWDLK